MSNQTFTIKQVDELKTHLWGKIEEAQNENKMLKFILALSMLVIMGLVMASMYSLTGSII